MAKVNQNKLIGGLAVAVITLVVVIIIVLIAQTLFPANDKQSSTTVLGTGTSKSYTASTTPAPVTDPNGQAVTTAPPEDPSQTQEPQTTTTTDGSSGTTVYLNTSVYLRAAADWNSTKGAIIPVKESAKVVRTEGDWYVLEYQGEQGYVYKDYISSTPIP